MRERPRGININIFLPDGTPEGLRIVERIGWTGVALACSRSQYPQVKSRDEFGRTGVYVLIDPSDDPDFPSIYVGEADILRDRLDAHVRKPEGWTGFVTFTSKDGNLNKAHAKNVESQLVKLGNATKRARLVNGNTPPAPQLSESEMENVLSFLDEMLVIYPLLGITAFESAAWADGSDDQPDATLTISVGGCTARGRDTAKGFVVLHGSQNTKNPAPSFGETNRRRWAELIKTGVLVEGAGKFYEYSQDYIFNSSSQAASIIMGYPVSGPQRWKDARGKSLKDIQAAALNGDEQ